MSERWQSIRLGDLFAEPARNGYSPKCPDEPNGRWVLSLGAVGSLGFNPDAIKPAPPEDEKIERFRLRDGDLLVSRSNTRERVGLAGIYSSAPEWCSYPDLLVRIRPDTERVVPRFLEHYLLSPEGREYFQKMARGTSGTMVKINREILEGLEVPLPPRTTQRSIVEILDDMRDSVRASEAASACTARIERLALEEAFSRADWPTARLGDLVERVRRPVEVDQAATYREIGVRSHGRGVFHKNQVTGADLGSKKVFWVIPGALVLNIVFAWERAVAVIGVQDDGFICSHRFPQYLPLPGSGAELNFLRLYFLTNAGNHQLRRISPGGAGRNKTMSQREFLEIQVPNPPEPDQVALCELAASLASQRTAEDVLSSRKRRVFALVARRLFDQKVEPAV